MPLGVGFRLNGYGLSNGDRGLVKGGGLSRVRLIQRVVNSRPIGGGGESHLRTAGDLTRARSGDRGRGLIRWGYAFFTRIKPFSDATFPPTIAPPMTARRPSANL